MDRDRVSRSPVARWSADIADFYNCRELLPDNGSPRALETIHRNRIRTVHSLFGPFELRRNYLHNAKSGSGRFPLDEVLGLEGACTPAVAKLMCKAASRAGSYQEAAADLFDYAALSFDARDLGRMVDCQAITTSQIPDVLDQWRHPAHSAFRERTTWSLFNAFTVVHKSVNPHTAMRRGEALHGSFDATAGLVLAS
jgi:hypothetical protein